MIDIQPFCNDDDEGRYDLSKPWALADGQVCATDGSILILVGSDKHTSTPVVPLGNRKVPKDKDILELFDVLNKLIDKEDFAWQPLIKMVPTCRLCYGAAEILTKDRCEYCQGKIITRQRCECEVETPWGQWLGRWYFNKLLNLPDCRWIASDDKERRVYFSTEFAKGAIMPLAPDSPRFAS